MLNFGSLVVFCYWQICVSFHSVVDDFVLWSVGHFDAVVCLLHHISSTAPIQTQIRLCRKFWPFPVFVHFIFYSHNLYKCVENKS